jgi:hypothetical protein
MFRSRHFLAMLALLQATGLSAAGALEGEWVSYRDAYRAMVVFEKYGGAKNLIQNQLLVLYKGAEGAPEPLRLELNGKHAHLKLALDATGRTMFPLLKAAYDENAVLAINRKDVQFALRPQVSIYVRTTGVYDTAELRAACEQALGFARYLDASARSLQCAGVRFIFDAQGAARARLHKADGTARDLPAAIGPAFNGKASFPTASYRFDGAEHAQVLTTSAPLAIVPLFE